jgi:hypothetical protein
METPSNSLGEFLFPASEHRFHWDMGMLDRIGIVHMLHRLRPDIAMEIGTFRGGSLEVIARHCRKAYSIDLNPEVARELRPHFNNVEFLSGDSRDLIGTAIKTMDRLGESLQFVLIDGDHSEAGARRDIDLVLQYRPRAPMCILMHDSFNPAVRRGIIGVNWGANPHVHLVEVDFTIGEASTAYDSGHGSRMWGGLALAVLYPERRSGKLAVTAQYSEQFERDRAAFNE